jgi:hypothetical protein
MSEEDEEFNRMEREADMRRKAVSAALNDHVMHMRAHLSEYERGVIDGRQMQMQSSVDKAVNAMSKREWVSLMDEELDKLALDAGIITWVRKVYDDADRKFYDLPLGEGMTGDDVCLKQFARLVEAELRSKNT